MVSVIMNAGERPIAKGYLRLFNFLTSSCSDWEDVK